MSIYDLPDLRPFRTIQNRVRLQGGAVVTENGILESADYVAGVSGWRVYGDGTVEFNNGTFRGTIDAAALNITITAAADGSIEFYDAGNALVGRLSADGWEIGDLDTPGLRATLDPIGGLRFRDESNLLTSILDQQSATWRDPTTGNLVAELGRTGFSLLDAITGEGITMGTSSVSSLAKPRYTGNTEAAPSSSLVIPAATILTANDLELGHTAAYKRGTVQTGTHTAPAGWTEEVDNDFGAASTLATSINKRSVATGTTGTVTSNQTNWDSACGAHVVVRGVVGGTTPSVRATSISETTTTATSVNVTLAKPTGTAEGDTLIVFISMGNALGGVPLGWTTPEGWVFLGAQVIVTGSGATLATLAVGCWAKYAGASEPTTYDTNINFSAGTKTIVAQMVAVQDGAVTGGGPSIEVFDENFVGAMTSYTPSHTNVTVGNGTETAKYLRMGKLCFVRYLLVWGTTTSLSPTYADFGLPFSPINDVDQQLIGHLLDSGTREVACTVQVLTSGKARFHHSIDTGTGNISATVPFTFVSGDRMFFQGWYEIA